MKVFLTHLGNMIHFSCLARLCSWGSCTEVILEEIMKSRPISLAALATLISTVSTGLTTSIAQAATLTWTGASTSSTNWSDPDNWSGAVAPISGDALVFDGSTTTTNTNDLASGTTIAGITWNNTGTASWTHNGTNSINLAGDLIYARTSLSATLLSPLVLQQNVNVDVASGGTLNLNGGISGGFSVTKTGSGLLSTSTSLTHTGGLNINGGVFRTTVSGSTTGSLGTGTISIDGGTLELRSTSATTFNNALVVGTSGARIDERSNHTFSPASITGSGTLYLRPTGADNLVMTLTDMKGWAGNLVADRNGRNTFGLRLANAFVNNSMLNLALTLNDNTYVTRQNGTNQPGTSVIDIGSLSSSFSNTSIGGSGSGTGYFVYSIGSLNTNTTFAGNIIDGGTRTALVKVGTGTLTLSGTANTFSGPSSINAGTLQVDGSLTNNNLVLTVNAGGTLAGSGSIAGSVSSVGGTIAPGSSPGTLTVGGMALDSNSILNYELNGGNTTIGSGINDLIVTGNLTLDGTINISETVAGSFATASFGSSWRLFNYTGTLVDNGLVVGTVPTLPSGGSFNIDTSVSGQVNLVLVPEPSSLMLLGALGWMGVRRRR